MLQPVGFDPSLTSLAAVDQRRPPENQPDSQRITPATGSEASSPDPRRSAPSDTPSSPPPLTRIAFTAKFGPASDGFPLQLIRGKQVEEASKNDPQAIVDNRVPQNDRRTALLQAQEARDNAAAADAKRQQAADEAAKRRSEADAADQAKRQADAAQAQDAQQPTPQQQQPAGSVLDLQV